MMLYETHTHTSAGSWCGKIAPEDLADAYKKMGFDGFCVTEHFPISKKFGITDWSETVDLIEYSFRRAEKRGKEIGIKVFFGFEYGKGGTHVLTFGLGAEWLRAHPEIASMQPEEYMRLAHDAGGFLIHAHPFRVAKWVTAIRLVPWLTDAVEVVNARRDDVVNGQAMDYAKFYDLKICAGTDNHVGFADRVCGITVDHELQNVQDLIDTIRSGKVEIFDRTFDPAGFAGK